MKERISISDKVTITGYVDRPTRVYITFMNGDIFYFRDIFKAGYFEINMPLYGLFDLHNFKVAKIEPIKISYPNFELKKPDRYFKKKLPIRTDATLTGTPARNYFVKGEIVLGEKFWRLPFMARLFILLHEHGHFLYRSEKDADKFALYHLLKNGYNNSSAYYSLKDVLNMAATVNKERVKNILNHSNYR